MSVLPSPAIRTEGLSRTFSGFRAVNDVSIAFETGGVRAIIGPNGAGKTTFFNLLSGLLAPSAGRVWLGERDVTRLPAFERARLGLARSFQITNIFGRLSVFENIRLAVQAAYDGRAWLCFPSRALASLGARTEQVLISIGLERVAGLRAENLSHGDQRRLEIGLVLARNPTVLLLDEPLAGMSPTETESTVELIKTIARQPNEPRHTVLLVEHDIDVVMAISDTITVMQTGGILAVGTPAEIRANDAVRRAYLGDLE